MSFFKANWQAPSNIIAGVTNRFGGVSLPPYDSFNLALHVEDKAGDVEKNRIIFAEHLGVQPSHCQWLEQVHGADVHQASLATCSQTPKADALITREAGVVCSILTADCLPILLCNKNGKEVAAIHAGWRSLVGGVIERTIEKMQSSPDELMAWLGPAIGPKQFEVGEDVKEAFHNSDFGNASLKSFKPIENKEWKYHANLYQLAKLRLRHLGLNDISGSRYCTVSEEQWFSYRRDGETGRMASFILIR